MDEDSQPLDPLEFPPSLALATEILLALGYALGGILLYEEPMMAPLHCAGVAGDTTYRFVMGSIDNHARTILFISNPDANDPLSPNDWTHIASEDLHW